MACFGGVLLAVGMLWLMPPVVIWLLSAGQTWPGVANPIRTIAGDLGDPTMQAWQLAWAGHSLRNDPADLWNTNAFYPELYTLAFSDSLLGYAPFSVIGTGPVAAVLRYNVVFVLTFALAFIGLYMLVRQLGANRIGALIAAVAFAYAPWRYAHAGHLNVLSIGAIPLALAMLARGHGWSLRHGYRPDRTRPGWALAGWLVAAWQITLGFGVGLPFVYALLFGCVVVALAWLVGGRPSVPRRLVLADVGGGAVFAAICGLMAYPYLQVLSEHPEAKRSWNYVAVFSPPLRGFGVAPPESIAWGSRHESARILLGTAVTEKELLCGFVLYGLAAAGLVFSVWTVRQRILLASGVLLSAFTALGTAGPLYWILYDHLPGFDGSRTPGRLVIWSTLLLAVLAAGMVTALVVELRNRIAEPAYRTVRTVVLLPFLLAVLYEGLPDLGHPVVPAAPTALATAPAPLIVLPTDVVFDNTVQLWATDRFPAMVNGGSSFNPPDRQRIREAMRHFPDAASIDMLRAAGVRSVVVVRNAVAGTPFEKALTAPSDGLGLTRQHVGDDIVYVLR